MTIIVPSIQDLSSASGLLNLPYMDGLYHSLMDEALAGIGREIIVHLPPEVIPDSTTNSQPQVSQYNPFFKRAINPSPTTRNAGTKFIPRDVIYKAHIRIGPKEANELGGMGKLKDNEAEITVVESALFHIKKARSISIEGRRYKVAENPPRPVGFLNRKYLLVRLCEIQEGDIQNDVGING